MSIIYYCEHCKKEIRPIMGKIQHPHLGETNAYVCPDCGRPPKISEDNRYNPSVR